MYRYMLQTFVPLLAATFAISWFIVIMQFVWLYVDDFVGKGVSLGVLARFMFYTAASLIPLALPLGILLASLMTFGNMGERLELLAMKSAGVSLQKIMKPIFVFVLSCSVGLFFFMNEVMPVVQVKLYTVIFSARLAKPELEIPAGTFYNGIKGYNIFVKKKENKTGLLKQVMIYDHSNGFERARIIRADSGRLVMDASNTYLTMTLHQGEGFEVLEARSYRDGNSPVPYANEQFSKKEIIIPFDSQFKMIDEGDMRSTYAGKNLKQLVLAADTAQHHIDSMQMSHKGLNVARNETMRYIGTSSMPTDSLEERSQYKQEMSAIGARNPERLDSVWYHLPDPQKVTALKTAVTKLEYIKNELVVQQAVISNDNYQYINHRRELHRKFTFPVACIVFFFIGAPLGAIIRKGGLGTPLVAAVLLFIVYYMIDSFGLNLVDTGRILPWQGSWLSTAVLLPIGAVLTYMAANDSASLSFEAWGIFIRKLFGRRGQRVVELKEVVIDPADLNIASNRLQGILQEAQELQKTKLLRCFFPFIWFHGKDAARLRKISIEADGLVDYLRDSEDKLLLSKLWDLPLIPKRLSHWLPKRRMLGILMRCLLPISIPLDVYFIVRRKALKQTLGVLVNELEELASIINNVQTKQTNK